MYTPHTAPISGIATRGNFTATAGYDNLVTVWDHKRRQPLARGCHDHLANSCAFSPDGSLLISASSDRSARLWEVPSMTLRGVLIGHTDDVVKASFDPDGQRICTSSYDHTLKVWDLKGHLLTTCEGHTGLIESFDWSLDGRMITSCGTDGTIRTWDAAQGRQTNIREGLEFDVDALVMLDGLRFIAGTDSGELWLVDGDRVERYPGHTSGVKRLVLSDDRSRLISLGYDQRMILWKLSGKGLSRLHLTFFPPYVWARAAAFLNNDEVVTGTFGSPYAHWHHSTGQWTCEEFLSSRSLNAVFVERGAVLAIGDAGILHESGKPTGGPSTLCNCLTSDGTGIWTGGQLGVIYDARTGDSAFEAGKPVNCATVLRLGPAPRLAFGTYGGSILVFETKPALRLIANIQLECNAIKGLTSLNGRIISGSADGSLAIIDGESFQVMKMTRGAHDGILNGLAPCGDGFATVSRDLTLRLWGPEADLRQTVRSRHSFSIKCIASSADHRWIATGSYGGMADIFDTARGAWSGDIKRPTMSGISSLAWHEAEKRFVAASYDGATYPIPTGV